MEKLFEYSVHLGEYRVLANSRDISDRSITSAKIALLAILSELIADGAVTERKLANWAVTTPKIADGAVTPQKLSQGVWDSLVEGLIKNTGSTAIGPDGYWWVDGEKTDVLAHGKDADQWTIGEDGYWWVNGEKTEYLSKGADGHSPVLRVSLDGMSLEVSSDGGQTWIPFVRDFNKLRVIGYVESTDYLPTNALLGDIYGVWNQEAESGQGAYELYINTVKRWNKEKDIDRVYEYDSELPSSAADGTAVLIPVSNDGEAIAGEGEGTTEWQDGESALDKKRVDGYKVYMYSVSARAWLMVLNTAEIFATATDIINHGDNVYALVQGASAGAYELYKREVGWVKFGTNASITYHVIQDVQEGTETNVPSGAAVKNAIGREAEARDTAISAAIEAEATERDAAISTLSEDVDTRLDNLERNVIGMTLTATPNQVFHKDRAETITLRASIGDLEPTVLGIYIDDVKINDGNEKTATYDGALTNDSTTLRAHAEYYDAVFDKSLTLQSRYPVLTIFAAIDAVLSEIEISAFTRQTARVSATGTYSFTNTGSNGYCPYLLVPSDVTLPSRFSMGGAPVAFQKINNVAIGDVTYTAYRLGSDTGYNTGTSLSIVAQ